MRRREKERGKRELAKPLLTFPKEGIQGGYEGGGG